ncbi:MAG: DUF4337 domain-containing protein [Nitrospirae bacterium]|nr:MAG: DUF4337 domain-containing protein [Nitrospirota bacterium]
MAEEKKEKWLNYVALTTVVLAVCATLSTFKAGGFSTKSVLSQTQSSDQWAYFQSKSIKGYLYELQKEKLELDMKMSGAKMPKALAEEYNKKIDAYDKKIKKYDAEKAKIEKDARALETVRDEAQKHSKSFGLAVIYLQLAIVLSSISALMKKKPMWYMGLALSIFGLVYFADGFLMFMK